MLSDVPCLLFCFEFETLFANHHFFFVSFSSQAGVLKALVTESTRMNEKNWVHAAPIKTHAHILLISNKDWVVPADADSRRWCISRVSSKYKGDLKYFEQMWNDLQRSD